MNVSRVACPAIICGLMMSACASVPADPGSATTDSSPAVAATKEPLEPFNPGSDVTCRYQRVTGSHMMRKICKSEAEKQRAQKDAQDWMRTGIESAQRSDELRGVVNAWLGSNPDL